jgi:4-hydroxybenzoate polyprenyltransferase
LPLFVDLDGSLIKSDLLWESVVLLLRNRPWDTLRLPFWLLSGRATLKARLAERCLPDPALLPYHVHLVEFLRAEAARGRSIVLATATHERLARAVAKHLGFFDGVLASKAAQNLKGVTKLTAIRAYCGNRDWKEFGYVGDSHADVPIWTAAAQRYMVEPTPRLRRRFAGNDQTQSVPTHRTEPWRAWLKAIRPHHWSKNLLLFVPLIASRKAAELGSLWAAAAAFLAFSITASAVYLFNDVLDIENDRRHPTKCRRAVAAGDLSIPTALLTGMALISGGMALAAVLLPPKFGLVLLGYMVVTFAYSLYLKRKLLADVLTLALLYTWRIVGGASAIGVEISHWLAMLSVFLFMSLAFAKRDPELRRVMMGIADQSAGRGYQGADLPVIRTMGLTCGSLAALVLAMYIQSEQVAQLYRYPQALWVLCLSLLYWITRLWFFAVRGELPDDPIVFALRDRRSWVLGLICVAALAVAGW